MESGVSPEIDLALLHSAFAALREAVVIVREDGAVLMVNSACRRLLGLQDEEWLPGSLPELLPLIDENTRDTIEFECRQFADADWLSDITERALIVRANGSEFPFDLTATRLTHNTVQGWIITLKDLFHLRSLSDTIHFQRSHDQLTGLCNRSEFERRLQDAIAQVSGSGISAAMAYIDVDQFKVVNDTCGHIAGDELLRQLADVIRMSLAQGDVLARLGGDEFGLLLRDVTLEEARKRAETIRRKVEESIFVWAEKNFSNSVSIGLVLLTGADQSWATLMGQADAACFHAKEEGRNQVRIYSTDDVQMAQSHTEMQWVSRIVQALQRDRFQLYAQPIVPVASGNGLSHQEILIRLVDEDGSIIPPGVFLPAAERFNLILMIDKWVILHTLDWLAKKIRSGEAPIRCAMNLSGASIGQVGFHEFVAQAITRAGVPADLCSFEITETAAINNLQGARTFISHMKALGCRFALDDFGAGMSSFAYLKNLPVDYLKIDGVFVKDLATDIIDYAMVKSINEIGHVMGMKTIAEFVENDAILAKLREIGVDYAQGYGIGKPQPLQ